MSFNYDVMTEEDAMKARFNLLENGSYEARIDKVVQKTSSTGFPQMELFLIVFNKQEEGVEVRDYVTITKKMMWKFIHLCRSAGLEKEYLDKTFFPEMLNGRMINVKIATQVGGLIPEDKLNGKDPGSKYPDRNVVDDYLVDNTGFESINSAVHPIDDKPFFDDSVPF